MRLMRISSIFDEVKQDAIKVDFRGINKFYGERIKQQFFFKQDFTSLPFDKISMRFSWRLRPFFGNFDEKGMKEKTKQRVLLFLERRLGGSGEAKFVDRAINQ